MRSCVRRLTWSLLTAVATALAFSSNAAAAHRSSEWGHIFTLASGESTEVTCVVNARCLAALNDHAGTSSVGLFGRSAGATGVSGEAVTTATGAEGVLGRATLTGGAISTAGVHGVNNSLGTGGGAFNFGVWGEHMGNGFGVYGLSANGHGVFGQSNSTAANVAGVSGSITSNAANAAGVRGQNFHGMCCGMGVAGFHNGQGIGIYGESLQGFAVSGFSPNNWSGYFQGDMRVVGNLQKNSGSFTIDHPLDPANKYLSHSFVESPDMKNVYDGVVRTDARGFATVRLPEYFSALNRSFRYQLTIVGTRGWNARVVKEIKDRRFTIQANAAKVKVSWQVTGIRKDRWANEHRIVVEEAKKPSEHGKYLNPELYGKPATRSVVVLPGLLRVKE